jgi:hypothetical protein
MKHDPVKVTELPRLNFSLSDLETEDASASLQFLRLSDPKYGISKALNWK